MEMLVRYTDLYPAKITPLPPNVPLNVKLRVVITDKFLTVAWLYGGGPVQRVDISLQPGDVGPDVTYSGGVVNVGVTSYVVTRNGACSICGGGRRMLGWEPFPEYRYIEEPRKQVELQQRTGNNRTKDGLIPPRYSRR